MCIWDKNIPTDSTTFEDRWLLVPPQHPRKDLRLRCKTSPNRWSCLSWRKQVMKTEKIEPVACLVEVIGIVRNIYLSGDVSDWSHCNLCHPVNARVSWPSGLGFLFDGTRGCENVFIRLRITEQLACLCIEAEFKHAQKQEYCSWTNRSRDRSGHNSNHDREISAIGPQVWSSHHYGAFPWLYRL